MKENIESVQNDVTEKKAFTNKKVFADNEIATFDEVFTCRNQDSQNLDTQTTKMYVSDINKIVMLSRLMPKKIGTPDILHNILNLYFEQNKEHIKEIFSKNLPFSFAYEEDSK